PLGNSQVRKFLVSQVHLPTHRQLLAVNMFELRKVDHAWIEIVTREQFQPDQLGAGCGKQHSKFNTSVQSDQAFDHLAFGAHGELTQVIDFAELLEAFLEHPLPEMHSEKQ